MYIDIFVFISVKAHFFSDILIKKNKTKKL